MDMCADEQGVAHLAREGGCFGDATISLMWNDETDLDLHVFPPCGESICYDNTRSCGMARLTSTCTPARDHPIWRDDVLLLYSLIWLPEIA